MIENTKPENGSGYAGNDRNGGVDPGWRVPNSQRTNRQSQTYNDKWQRNRLKQTAPECLSAIDHELPRGQVRCISLLEPR